MKERIVLALLVVVVFAPLAAQTPTKSLEFSLGNPREVPARIYDDDDVVRLTYRLKNTSDHLVSILIREHHLTDGDHFQFPEGMSVKVVNADGVVLTKNQNGDWWTPKVLIGCGFEVISEFPPAYVPRANEEVIPLPMTEVRMAGDVITMRPGEEFRRVTALRELLRGLRTAEWEYFKGLKPGSYTIQLRLHGVVVSAPLPIVVEHSERYQTSAGR